MGQNYFQAGVTCNEMKGTPTEFAGLGKSYAHLCKLRDELIEEVLPIHVFIGF